MQLKTKDFALLFSVFGLILPGVSLPFVVYHLSDQIYKDADQQLAAWTVIVYTGISIVPAIGMVLTGTVIAAIAARRDE